MINIKKILGSLEEFVINIPFMAEKWRIINHFQSELNKLEYEYSLRPNDKLRQDIIDTKRLIKASGDCPAILLVSEVNIIKGKRVTEEESMEFLYRIESYSK